MALLLEAFYGGSHKQLADLLATVGSCKLYTAPAKKFHWRLRSSAMYFANKVDTHPECSVLFLTSTINLAELCGLRPDLAKMRKILYFHENQLVYPVRKAKDLDFQLGYAQIVSCFAANVVVFNSQYNRSSFLDNVQSHVNCMPDLRVKDVRVKIEDKCRVLYYPLELSKSLAAASITAGASAGGPGAGFGGISAASPDTPGIVAAPCTYSLPPSLSVDAEVTSSEAADGVYKPLHIIWPHRWEHDKNPELLFKALRVLVEEGQKFSVSVVGESYSVVPDVFVSARDWLGPHVVNWGYLSSRAEYLEALQSADVVVSTAIHEFFGVAMLEAVHNGCYPLCPNSLVYPELFPKECLYSTDNQLVKRLRSFCRFPQLAKKRPQIDFERLDWDRTLRQSYVDLLGGKEPSWSVPG